MNFADYFPVWDKLTSGQRDTLSSYAAARRLKKGENLYHGLEQCTGLILVSSGPTPFLRTAGRSPCTASLTGISACFPPPA